MGPYIICIYMLIYMHYILFEYLALWAKYFC